MSGYLGFAPVHWSSNACSAISSRRVEEVFLVNAVVFDGLLNSDALLELVDSFYKILKLLLVVLAAESEAVGNLCVAGKGVRMVVLRESAHLGGSLGSVEAENLFNHQRVCNAVGEVVKAPSLCAMEWQTPRKAFAKAIPAIVAAFAIFSRATDIRLTVLVCARADSQR